MNDEIIKYEKTITLNVQSASTIKACFEHLIYFIDNKCKKDKENLEYFQLNFTDSENSPFSKDLKIKWAVKKK